jgi:hypothetical protein
MSLPGPDMWATAASPAPGGGTELGRLVVVGLFTEVTAEIWSVEEMPLMFMTSLAVLGSACLSAQRQPREELQFMNDFSTLRSGISKGICLGSDFSFVRRGASELAPRVLCLRRGPAMETP